MKKGKLTICIKGVIGLFLFVLLMVGNSNVAKANSIKNLSDSTVAVNKSADFSESDLQNVMSALEGHNLSDGESITVGDYRIDCEITVEPTKNNNTLLKTDTYSSNSLASIPSGETSSYGASCNLYISCIFGNVYVAVISQEVNITNFDTGKVHINSGSVNVTMISSTWTGSAYGYTIHNTDGSYSSAYGLVSLYCKTLDKTAKYKAYVTVTPKSAPSFGVSAL